MTTSEGEREREDLRIPTDACGKNTFMADWKSPCEQRIAETWNPNDSATNGHKDGVDRWREATPR